MPDDDNKDTKKELTAKDPGHSDHDCTKDARVKKITDTLFSKQATLQATIDELQTKLKTFDEEKKKKDEGSKTEIEKILEKLAQTEKVVSDMEKDRAKEREANVASFKVMKAKTLVQDALIKTGLAVSTITLRGLVNEIQDKMVEDDEENTTVVEEIITKFADEEKAVREKGFKGVATPKEIPKKGQSTNADLMTRLNSARLKLKSAKNAIEQGEARKEIEEIMKKLGA